MQLVHLGTVVQSVFGVVDEKGNVITQEPLQAQMILFSKAEFESAFKVIEEQRDARQVELAPEPAAKPQRKPRQ